MIEQKVIETINKYNLITEGDNIVVGVSGGPDSMCLLSLLNSFKEKMNFKINVCHVNHCLRENAIIDQEYVEKFCEKENIPCYVKKVDVKSKSKSDKMGIEEAARILRYSFFEEIALKTNSNKIAIAHNSNDNAETIIMNLIRGSGISGLKGIQAKRDEKYIRPLIECLREEIEEYCLKKNLNPRHDESNDCNLYTRNKIRNEILPYIKREFNPNIVNGLNKLSKIVEDDEKFFIKILKQEYNNIVIKSQETKIVIDLKKFNKLDIAIKRKMVLYIINKLQRKYQRNRNNTY